jgi:hypothetical protein
MVLHLKLLAQPQQTWDERMMRKNSALPAVAAAASAVAAVVVVVDGGEPSAVLPRDVHDPHLKADDFAVVAGESPSLTNRR